MKNNLEFRTNGSFFDYSVPVMNTSKNIEKLMDELYDLSKSMNREMTGKGALWKKIKAAYNYWIHGKASFPETVSDLVTEYSQKARGVHNNLVTLNENLNLDRARIDNFIRESIQLKGTLTKEQNELHQAHKKRKKLYKETLEVLSITPNSDEDHAKYHLAEYDLRRELTVIKQNSSKIAERLSRKHQEIGLINSFGDCIDHAISYTNLTVERSENLLTILEEIQPSINTYLSTGEVAKNFEKTSQKLKQCTKAVIGLFGKAAQTIAGVYSATRL